MKRGRTAGIVAVTAILSWLAAGAAWANNAGGLKHRLRACTASLNACDENLTMCTADLGVATGDLETCAGDLLSCAANLSTCDGNLGTCTADLGDCRGDAIACNDALAECEEAQRGIPIAGGATLAYEDCGDGTVSDLRSGLMWEKKTEGGSSACLIPLHGVDTTCAWLQLGSWIVAVNAEGGAGYAGHSDWRLPSVKELQSIVDYSRTDPAIHSVFGPTTSFWYWSATPTAVYSVPQRAWVVDFTGGSVFPDDTSFGRPVRAVREGSCR